MSDLRVLVVEDEPVAADAHTMYVGRVPGFTVVGTVHTARDALRALTADEPIDLVLLDMNLPDGHGLDVVRRMRAQGVLADVVAVTSARELDTVRAAVSLGVVQYLLKPFVFASLRERLEAYADYHRATHAADPVASQGDVDRVLAGVHRGGPAALPKGLAEDVWGKVLTAVRRSGAASSGEVAEAVGVSRVTARRYLEHLADSGLATRHSRHAGTGRPEVEYRWVGR
ncbi:response regulator [Lapillicoccus jejuensis]|uniref:response regulator n=1 Tax=Lapillicoccus jejuensis TaxID=402171 RepID=UPI001B87C4DF|nr:response regulator [Lapillicoccus jejuensis]